MQYSNYDMKNNVHATLSTAVSSVATTIQLTSWQWSRFWTTFPQIATLESFDENWKVIKREIVKITWRSGDNLTVVRAFAPCPSNDDANSQTQTSISFNADDTISLYIPKEIFDIIKKSLNDIYDNGANNMRTELVSWLQVEVNPWSVLVWSAYYDFPWWTITLTDNATNYLEVDEDGNLANNTSGRNDENTKLAIITTSGGSVTNIKDRRLWTVWWKIGWVNIHDLTEKTTLVQNDEFIVADSENIYQNKRVKMPNILNINALTEKKRTAVNDFFVISDSENWNVNKKISIWNAIPPTTLNRDTTSYKIWSSDDLDYFVLYMDTGIRVYHKNIRLWWTTNTIITWNASWTLKWWFIYEWYVYILSTVTQKIYKCKLTDAFNVSANWTATDYGTTESNYFIWMEDWFIYFINNWSTNNIRKYDLTMTLQDTISFSSISVAPSDWACIAKEWFYIKQNWSDNKYFIPNEWWTWTLIWLEQYILWWHWWFLYWAPNTAWMPFFFLH